jgi:hypothetical protein
MKDFIKQKLSENLVYEVIDSYLQEDYPSNFDLEEFSKLTSYKKRIQYCQERLKRISSGSSRIVYMVDDTKVLKIAKNEKGLNQNDIEATYSTYHDIKDITAQVFAYDNNDLWVEMELARKVTPKIFLDIVGFTFDDYCIALNKYFKGVNPQRANKGWFNTNIDQEKYDAMWENEFIYDMFSFIGNYDTPVGDLQRLNSYGLVKRNGVDTIVLIDYGITWDGFDAYYK